MQSLGEPENNTKIKIKLKKRKVRVQNQQGKDLEISMKSMKKRLITPLPDSKRRANVTEKAEDEFLCFSPH